MVEVAKPAAATRALWCSPVVGFFLRLTTLTLLVGLCVVVVVVDVE